MNAPATPTVVDHRAMKLGKKAPRHDHRTLRMAKYLTSKLPVMPWLNKCAADFGMMGNSDLGDCTIAALGHAIQVWTANASKKEVTLADSIIISAYEAFCGYKPGDPNNTDQGGVEIDVLNDFRRDGIAGHALDSYVALEPHNDHHLQTSIGLFGVAYVGIALPLTAQDQEVWSVVPNTEDAAPGSWGGHAVILAAYSPTDYTCITWGKPKRMTRAFAHKYIDEAYALLSKDWANLAVKGPSGFDYAALRADLALL